MNVEFGKLHVALESRTQVGFRPGSNLRFEEGRKSDERDDSEDH
jgi:hypothetical protein